MNLSENITRKETMCRCGECTKFSADIELVSVIQMIRNHYGAKAIIHSWFRCFEHNNRPVNQSSTKGIKGAGSEPGSWHPTGGACDFHIEGVTPEELAKFIRLKFPNQYGVGLYDWGCHLDVRNERADWDERTRVLKA